MKKEKVMVWPFKKKKTFDDAKQLKFVQLISSMLEMQKIATGGRSIEDGEGRPKRKAIGYIYGFIDAALQMIGQDMSDPSIGIPILCEVLNRLFPGRVEDYAKFLVSHMGKDELVTLGAMHGGQQYLKYIKPGSEGMPMGLARFIVEGDK
jgi:hypothetical protein